MNGFGFPYRIGSDGRTVVPGPEAYVRGLVEQVLFTQRGERVMRPELGAGVHELVFAENAPELAATVQHMVQAALQQWLAATVEVREVLARADGSRLDVTVRYRPLDATETRTVTVTREV